MSYDLLLYKKKSSALTEDQVATWLTNNLTHNISEQANQWHYDNEDTGVYFLVDREEALTDAEHVELFESYADYTNLHFTIGINFIRPTFFAFEIFPIVDRMVEELDLYILNMQDHEDPDNPRKFPAGYLQDQWIRYNNQLTLDNFSNINPDYLPLKQSNELWQYQSNKTALEEAVTEAVYVPTIIIVKSQQDAGLHTVCVWPSHIPTLFPPVDQIFVIKEYEEQGEMVKQSGLVSYSTIMNLFGDKFEQYPHQVPNIRIIQPENAASIGQAFNALTLEHDLKDFGTRIGLDGFVNVRP